MSSERNYAEALFDLALEDNCLDLVFDKLNFIKENILTQEGFLELLLSPNIAFKQKESLLNKIFLGADSDINANNNNNDDDDGDAKENKMVLNFILVLIKRNKLPIINLIINNFFDMYYDHKNILRAKVYSAVKLSDSVLFNIKNVLEKKYSSGIILENIIDKNVIAGFLVKINGTLVDLSICSQLNNLKKYLLESYLNLSNKS